MMVVGGGRGRWTGRERGHEGGEALTFECGTVGRGFNAGLSRRRGRVLYEGESESRVTPYIVCVMWRL
jgi:hypothetical protein